MRRCRSRRQGRPATKAELAGWSSISCASWTRSSFFRAEERRASLIRAITVMLERRQWTGAEVHLMRGIIKDLAGGRKARQKISTTVEFRDGEDQCR